MLNEKKIRIMSRLASFEKKENQEEFKRVGYYKSDYIRYNLLKTVVSVTIGYILILVLLVFYNAEFLITNAVTLNYKEVIGEALIVYFILLIIYVIGTIFMYSLKYDKTYKFIGRYFKMLGVLRKFYKDEEGQK